MGKRDFYTGSVQIISDPRLSGLDHRTYACISMHDGMSLKKGSGRGCYATFATLTAALGCDASNLSKSIKRLVGWGYITEERQADRRRKTYRVVFDFPDGWSNHQQSNVGEIANDTAETPSEIVGRDECENGRNPLLDAQHYSSLKGLDSLKREKLDSSEEARLAARCASKIEFSDNDRAQMSRLERSLKAGSKVDCLAWYGWLTELAEGEEDNGIRNHAYRLSELVLDAMTPGEYEQWGKDHGWVDDEGQWDVDHPRGEYVYQPEDDAA